MERKLAKKAAVAAIALVLTLSAIASGSFIFQINRPAGSGQAGVFFAIEKGQGVNEISRNLKMTGLIKSRWGFELYAWLRRLEGSFAAGEYLIRPDSSIIEVTDILTSGDVLSLERSIRIIEGWTIEEVAQYLEGEGVVPEKDFLEAAGEPGRWTKEYPYLELVPPGKGLEGFLFPDTYRIYKDASAEDIIGKMLANFDSKLTPEMRRKIEEYEEGLYETVVLASLIEKEVRSEEDRRMVSDIFRKRLEIGQPLGASATLTYILGIKKGQYSLEDTEVDSPYNTYKNAGLPPGPICSPGETAIHAAVDPIETEYWYFLSAKDDGRTIFSETFEEHIANKARYLN